MSHKPYPIAERFWPKVDKQGPVPSHRPELGPCWVWTASLNNMGYGKVYASGRVQSAHRVSWAMEYGCAPEGRFVLHACDNPPCVRPSHLFIGDYKANTADMLAKGRFVVGDRLTHASRGEGRWSAKLTEDQVKAIRERYAAGGVYQRDLAAEYGVRQPQISRIVSGARWQR